MVGLRIIAMSMFGFLLVLPALSQALPSCISIASDADGDGYGWENDASCVITTSQCLDTDGDGWGWNGITSCQLEVTAPVCVDSPPVGDGWGWDGITSCQLEVTAPMCMDSPPSGDGWGWNGITSCQIENTVEIVAGDLDNIPDPLEQLSLSTIISPSELLNVPLSCRRVRWLSQFESNPPRDRLEEQDPSRIFFTATFQQDPIFGWFGIEGSWDDIYSAPVSQGWDMSSNDVGYTIYFQPDLPPPQGTLNFHMLDQFIAIDQTESLGNNVSFITSYCVNQ